MRIKRSLLEDLRDKDAMQEAIIQDLQAKLDKAIAEKKHLSSAIESLEALEVKPK